MLDLLRCEGFLRSKFLKIFLFLRRESVFHGKLLVLFQFWQREKLLHGKFIKFSQFLQRENHRTQISHHSIILLLFILIKKYPKLKHAPIPPARTTYFIFITSPPVI